MPDRAGREKKLPLGYFFVKGYQVVLYTNECPMHFFLHSRTWILMNGALVLTN